MNDYNEILNGPKGFYCEHFKTRMLKKSCILRQERAYKFSLRNGTHPYTAQTEMDLIYCRNCDQGKETIREELDGKIKTGKEIENKMEDSKPICTKRNNKKKIERTPTSAKLPLSLNLDLTPWPEVIEHLQEAARVNIRTIEHQAIALIVKGLKADGYGTEEAA